MTLLKTAEDESFAVGGLPLRIGAASPNDRSNRFLVQIRIAEHSLDAFVDTGAPFSGIVTMQSEWFLKSGYPTIEEQNLRLRGTVIPGKIVRLPVTLPATQGESVSFECPFFLATNHWLKKFRPFVGIGGFLDQLRVAFDPTNEMMYFGAG